MSGSATRIRRATDPHRSGMEGRMARTILTLEERFMSKVEPEPNTGCWLWVASIFGNTGYGLFNLVRDGRKSADNAHRVSWEIFRGEIPKGAYVLHRCDVRTCVNPDHLFIGSHQDNMTDCARKGRARSGRGLYPFGVRFQVGAFRPKPFGTQVTFCGRHYSAGYFSTIEEASIAATALKERLYREGKAQ